MSGPGNAPLTVSQAARLVKGTVNALKGLVVIGEVSGFTGPNKRSGHCYFDIKDEASTLSVIVWRGIYEASGIRLKDGLEIQVVGRFDVYPASGKLSLIADSLQVSGEGVLRQRVAELARKLASEGLMAPERKRKVPQFCTRICVVTSYSGKVLGDVKETLARRNPFVEIDVVGCSVQGADAPPTIIRGLARAAASRPDAILLVRGGGSYEDLMCFNDEGVARAVANCPVPVVTGIGHDPDITICDMVADRHCATPTMAAQEVAPSLTQIVKELEGRRLRLLKCGEKLVDGEASVLSQMGERLKAAGGRQIVAKRAEVESLASHACLMSPDYIVQSRREMIELTSERLHDAMPRLVSRMRDDTTRSADALDRAGARLVVPYASKLNATAKRLDVTARGLLSPHEASLARAAAQLDALSPLKVLGRGYAFVRDDEGHVVTKAASLAAGQDIEVNFADGTATANVTRVRKE